MNIRSRAGTIPILKLTICADSLQYYQLHEDVHRELDKYSTRNMANLKQHSSWPDGINVISNPC